MNRKIKASVVRFFRTTEDDGNHDEVVRLSLDLVLVPRKSKRNRPAITVF